MSHTCPECGHERDRGAVLAIVALVLITLITFSALTVDIGRLMIKRRDLQALADVVSLDLVRDLNFGTKASYDVGNPNSAINQHKIQSVNRNGGDPTKVTFELGQQNGKGAAFTSIADDKIPNAVKVTATDSVTYFFAQVIGQRDGTTSRSAVAGQTSTLDYEAGSFLASTVQQGLLNGLLGGALGGPVNLSVLSYQGLAATNVPLGPLATQLGLGSPDQLLNTQIGQKQLYLATASVLSSPGGCSATPAQCTAAITAFNALAASTSASSKVNLGGLADIEQGGSAAAANGSLNALGLVTGSAFLVNGTNTVSVPGLNVNIPGVGSTTVQAKITQGIVQKYGAIPNDPASAISTSQIDVTLTTTLNIGLGGILTGVSGPLTVRTQIGGATAIPTAASCAAPKGATVGVSPQPVTITGNEHLTVLGLLGLQVLKIDVNNLNAQLTGTPQSHSYAYPSDFKPNVGTGTDVTLGSSTIGLPNLFQGTTANATLLSLPLGQTLSSLLSIVNASLNPVLAAIDDLVVSQLAQVLGIYLGGAAVGALDLHCDKPQLIG